jgi:excisionase family DNA binding protein
MMPPSTQGRAATLDEVADYLGLTTRVVRNLTKKYGIPALDTGAQLRFDELAFNALLEALRCRSMSNPAPTVQVPYRSRGSSRSPTAGGSKYAAVLDRISSNSREKKQRRSKPASCATPTTGNVVALAGTRKP